MDRKTLSSIVEEMYGCTAGNTILLEKAERRVTLFEKPLIGIASASDSLFLQYKKPEVIGSEWMMPDEWLPEVKSIISMFFPFTAEVRKSNRGNGGIPSEEWLYGRVEGDKWITEFMCNLQIQLEQRGIQTCIPAQDSRFFTKPTMKDTVYGKNLHIISAWSERHAAYACGLGTFGLSRGIITEKGMAGRLASILLDEVLIPDTRNYTGIYDYCIRCGVCIPKCPAGAISLENGKDNVLCREWAQKMRDLYKPRYGCGKCQLGVPCEHGIPGAYRNEI